jgi:hypothetical protein
MIFVINFALGFVCLRQHSTATEMKRSGMKPTCSLLTMYHHTMGMAPDPL